jgi:hypothetical protein
METSYFYTCNYVIINTLKLKKGEDEENVAREIEHTFIKIRSRYMSWRIN